MTRLALAFVVAALTLAAPSLASAPPVGKLPPGPVQTISTTRGQLVAIALPHGVAGRVWRGASWTGSHATLHQVSEADVDKSVVLVFHADARGTVTIRYALTRGETAHAYAARTFRITVR